MPPINIGRGGGPRGGINISLVANQRDFNAAIRYLNRYQGIYAQKYVQKVMYAGAKIPVKRMQASIPVLSGNLRKSIRARQNRLRPREMGAATVGPDSRRYASHAHLYIRGTKPHSLAGGSTGRAGKKQYSFFPDRGVPYNLKKVPASQGPSRYKDAYSRSGMVYLAYNPWLQHHGAPAHGQLDTIWSFNKPGIQLFVDKEIGKLGQGITGFTGVRADLP